jgi:signal transduction histidine kinase
LFQLLVNLLDNAVKYTPAGGHIEVRVKSGARSVDLVVADSGPGIPAAMRARVLNRFFRLEESRNTRGNGLGLSLVDAVARYHGAALSLTDNNPGLIVTVCFPPTPDQGRE